ncbi:MAG: hypothetical protein JXB13_10040 [Phycisphaerae bacterium]|nr:hypothetical protein [Phycisphaerae bacterium]
MVSLALKLLTAAVLLPATAGGSADEKPPAVAGSSERREAEPVRLDATVEVHATEVLVDGFGGVGVEWSAYPWWDVSDEDWQKVFRRLEFMRLPLARVMLDAFWYCQGFDAQGEPIYTWDTPFMQKLYRLLDWCQRNNTVVIIGEWGRPNGRDLDLAADDLRWTRIIADFVEHMVRRKGYTCLKHYNIINEPHGSWTGVSWDEWYAAITGLHGEFKRRGLLDQITIAAPDGDRSFTTRCLRHEALRELTGVYDEHWYLLALEVERGLPELYTREQLRQIHRRDPGKRLILGEVGLADGKTEKDQQPNVYKFWYGVSMADAAIQMIRGGMSGFIAWDLDDSMHFLGDGGESMNALSDVRPDDAYERRKIWGFWSILGAEHGAPEDENMRPWFFPWAVLSRAFPPGCQTLETDASGIPDLRVTAARIPAGAAYHLSFAVANNSPWPRHLRVRVPEMAGRATLGVYEYFDSNADNVVDSWPRVVDDQGRDVFPRSSRTLTDVALGRGLVLSLPTKGVLILTTLEHGDPVPLEGSVKSENRPSGSGM